ncbi:GTPase Era [Egicoccus sp. AB-alg6-2]|uniref:GTPase Era n=1 Tax=Egicoccus sp. AB-alg6-2 TaxID=3242692 RepID=UPI00359D6E4B
MSGRELDLQAILAGADEPLPEGHRSGLLALVGRPNVGKSTLLNQMVGEKVAIVTQVPGTTRNAIRGVVTRADAQLVFLDTPGLAKPHTLLTRRLNELVRDTWAGVDAVCFLVDVADGIGKGDEFLASELAGVSTPVVAVANKVDLVRDKASLLPQLERLQRLLGPDREFADMVPVSAETGENVDRLLDVLVSHLHEGPRLFGAGYVSDQPEAQLAAEILREKLIADLKHELPHSVAVTVDEIRPSDEREDLLEVDAVIHVERDSQKGIVIGKRGANLKAAATAARRELEVLLGAKVYLTTHVTVAKEWQRDPKQLGRLGY